MREVRTIGKKMKGDFVWLHTGPQVAVVLSGCQRKTQGAGVRKAKTQGAGEQKPCEQRGGSVSKTWNLFDHVEPAPLSYDSGVPVSFPGLGENAVVETLRGYWTNGLAERRRCAEISNQNKEPPAGVAAGSRASEDTDTTRPPANGDHVV